MGKDDIYLGPGPLFVTLLNGQNDGRFWYEDKHSKGVFCGLWLLELNRRSKKPKTRGNCVPSVKSIYRESVLSVTLLFFRVIVIVVIDVMCYKCF